MKLTKLRVCLMILIPIICIFLLFVLTPIGLSQDQADTLNSIQVHENGTYMTMNASYVNSSDYIKGNGIFSYLIENFLSTKGGIAIPNPSALMCSAFYKKDTNGHWVTGRNFDLYDVNSKAVIINSTPKKGYRSIAISDTCLINNGLINLGNKNYLTLIRTSLDGVNEKGVSISTLMLLNESVYGHNDSKPSLVYSDPVRLVLDNANSTEEAIKLLKEHNFKNDLFNCHFFITDKNGKSIDFECIEDKVFFYNTTILTNNKLNFTSNDTINPGSLLRYKIINESIDKDKPMEILKKVSRTRNLNEISSKNTDLENKFIKYCCSNRQELTFYSVVYDNTDPSMTVCFKQNYNKTYKFEF